MFGLFGKWQVVGRYTFTCQMESILFRHKWEEEKHFIVEEKRGKRRAFEVTSSHRKPVDYDWLASHIKELS